MISTHRPRGCPVLAIAHTAEDKAFRRLLDPVDRISEILFGLIMVLTSRR
jgi:hypothetical protein